MAVPMRRFRERAGLTQQQLADRAGVSRQLVGAVETGRHLPRVDAAMAIAAVLHVDVPVLFGSVATPVDVVTGSLPQPGSLVRVGSVGGRTVTVSSRVGSDGWGVADGIVEAGGVTSLGRQAPGLVVAGCEPGLEVMERILRERGMTAVAAMSSSTAALAALGAGRVHAAVAHGPALTSPPPAGLGEVVRFRVAKWQVGLAGSPDAAPGWWQDALSGRKPVVQRETGAGVQRAFERALTTDAGEVPGPRVSSHMEAALRAVLTGMPAVTIEPAARANRTSFHPLETHEAEIWIAAEWMTERPVVAAMDVLVSARFQRRLRGVGGYDLAGCGTKVA